MNSIDVFKQLIVNYLMNSKDLQEEVKSYIFYDKKEFESRHNKRGLINQFKLGLNYFPSIKGHWALCYRYERQLQAVNCEFCGQFHIANNQDSTTLPENMICNCHEEYVEEIINYQYILQNALTSQFD